MSGPWQGSNGDQQGNQHGGPGYGGYQEQPALYQPGPGHPQPGYGRQPDGGPDPRGGFSQAEYQQSQFGPGGYPQGGAPQGGYPAVPPGYPGSYGRPPRNPNRTLIIVVLGVLLLAGAGVGSYFLFFKKDSASGGSTATAVADQLKSAIDRNDYAAVNDLTCTAEKVPAEQIQFTVDQITSSGATLSVTIESVQESGDTAAVQYTIHSQNPQTNENKEVQQTATLHKNAAGRWIACDGQLGPQDQG